MNRPKHTLPEISKADFFSYLTKPHLQSVIYAHDSFLFPLFVKIYPMFSKCKFNREQKYNNLGIYFTNTKHISSYFL